MSNRQQLVSFISIIGLAALVVFSLLMYQSTSGTKKPGWWGKLFGSGMPAAMVGGDGPQTQTTTNNNKPTGPQSFSNFDTYTNGPGGWRISFPHNFALTTQANLSVWSLTTGTLITFDPAMFAGTNLSEATVALAQFPQTGDVVNCFPNLGEKPKPTKMVLNGTAWQRSDLADAGAGNLYETETYVTTGANTCYVVSLQMHSTNLGNYDDANRPKPFDKAAVEKTFNTILNSFSWVE